MTVLTEKETITRTSVAPVVRELALVEAIGMLRHPLSIVGVAGSLWAMWALFGGRAPVLERDSILIAGAMLPIAAATLLVAFYSVLRHRRLPEVLSAQPTNRNARLMGIQLGTLGPAAVSAVLSLVGVVYLLAGEPIGELLWWELISGVVMVPAAGVLGTALARWLPHPVVAPIALVGLAVVQFWASPDFGVLNDFAHSTDDVTGHFEWLAPWMTPSSFSPPDIIVQRPAVLHVVYLVVLALVLAYLTQERRSAGRIGQAVVAVILLVAVASLSFSLPAHSLTVSWPEAADAQVCEVEDGIEYCALKYHDGWNPRWHATVAAVNELAPVQLERVIQRPHNIGFDPDPSLDDRSGLALTTLEWDRPGAMPEQEFSLALIAAQTTVGLPALPQVRPLTEAEIDSIVSQNPDYPGDLREQLESEPVSEQVCSGVGQARSVVAVWLAASATTDGTAMLDWLLDRRPDAETLSFAYVDPHHIEGVTIGRSDAELSRELLDLQQADVLATIEDRWDEVLDPATTPAELGSWLGLAAHEQVELDYFEAPCP